MTPRALCLSGLMLLATCGAATAASPTVPVKVDDFVRAESDRYLAATVRRGAFGKLVHDRVLRPLEQVTVVTINRDTLYSLGVFDLDAGPVTVSLPDAGRRYMSLVMVNQDHEVTPAVYAPGTRTYTREQIGTRYVLVGIRTLFDPTRPEDLAQVHALQDAIRVSQPGTGRFEVPAWDPAQLKAIRDPLLALRGSLDDSRATFGSKKEVSPVRHLIGTANAWGGNREQDALYFYGTPNRNDGVAVYRMRLQDVPVDAFWSVSVYDAAGYFRPNLQEAYTLNTLSARPDADGAVTIQFGGCEQPRPNCLPTLAGWNYMLRLYQPRAEVLDGRWTVPTLDLVTP